MLAILVPTRRQINAKGRLSDLPRLEQDLSHPCSVHFPFSFLVGRAIPVERNSAVVSCLMSCAFVSAFSFWEP